MGHQFIVYRDADGTRKIAEGDEARRQQLTATTGETAIGFTTYDHARREVGVEPRELRPGVRLSGRICQSSPPGPEHDRFEHLVDYRPLHSKERTVWHVWATLDYDDFARQMSVAHAVHNSRYGEPVTRDTYFSG